MNKASSNFPAEQPTLRMLAMPTDTNSAGDIFGGWITAHADLSGSIVAHKATVGRVATIAIDKFEILNPIFIGDVVSFYSCVTKTGKSSIQINTIIWVQRDHLQGETICVGNSTITYVAIDKNRQPRKIISDQ